MTAEDIIRILQLEQLPIEGGVYRRTYFSPDLVAAEALPGRYDGDRPCSSAIYYLITPDACSRLHRLRTDEVFHFYLGDPALMLLLYSDGESRVLTLGPRIDAGQHVQVIVPHGTWLGLYVDDGGDFTLMGTTMAPAFDPDDFELGDRDSLIEQYPRHAEQIARLAAP